MRHGELTMRHDREEWVSSSMKVGVFRLRYCFVDLLARDRARSEGSTSCLGVGGSCASRTIDFRSTPLPDDIWRIANRGATMATNDPPYEPPWATRVLSNTTVGFIGFLCRSFLYGLSTTEVHGFEHFKDLVDERSDPQWRQRGLITGAQEYLCL